jgi:hypothetical protein
MKMEGRSWQGGAKRLTQRVPQTTRSRLPPGSVPETITQAAGRSGSEGNIVVERIRPHAAHGGAVGAQRCAEETELSGEASCGA